MWEVTAFEEDVISPWTSCAIHSTMFSGVIVHMSQLNCS